MPPFFKSFFFINIYIYIYIYFIEVHYKKILYMIFKLLFNFFLILNIILGFYGNINNFIFFQLLCTLYAKTRNKNSLIYIQ